MNIYEKEIESLISNTGFKWKDEAVKMGNLYVLKYKRGDHFCLKIWKNKAINPYVNCYSTSEEKLDKYVSQQIAFDQQAQKTKLERKEARKITPEKLNQIAVGDIFYSSWGYDQTNVEFFQIIEVKKASVKVVKIASSYEEVGYMSGYETPIKDSFIDEPVLKKLNYSGSSFSLKISRCSRAYKWDGKKLYSSSYA